MTNVTHKLKIKINTWKGICASRWSFIKNQCSYVKICQYFRGVQYFKLRGQAAQEMYFGLFNSNDEDLMLLRKAGRCHYSFNDLTPEKFEFSSTFL